MEGSSGSSSCVRRLGPSGHPGPAPPTCSSRPSLGLGVVQVILEVQRVPQMEVMLELFAGALGQAQSPPILEWCQNKALCTLGAQ
ncbi:hypothetical protein E4T56_gene6273 [Termitomyces sp. T112]|nr:hypothetical protein E4T56_gene6273 [Termitomyces sp. T112]